MEKRVFVVVGVFVVFLMVLIFLPGAITGNVVADYCDKDFCLGEGNNETNLDFYVSSIDYDFMVIDLQKKNMDEFFVEPKIEGINSSFEMLNWIVLINSKGYLTGKCEFVYPNETGCFLSGLISPDYYTLEIRLDMNHRYDEKYLDNNKFRESFYFGNEPENYIEFKEGIDKFNFEGNFCSGCYVRDRCLPVGYNDEGLFCSEKGIKEQFALREECEFDFECLSLNCVEGRCK